MFQGEAECASWLRHRYPLQGSRSPYLNKYLSALCSVGMPKTQRHVDDKVPPEEEVDALAGITYLWCTQQGLILLFSFAKGFLTPFESLQAVLLIAAAVCSVSTSRWYRMYKI